MINRGLETSRYEESAERVQLLILSRFGLPFLGPILGVPVLIRARHLVNEIDPDPNRSTERLPLLMTIGTAWFWSVLWLLLPVLILVNTLGGGAILGLAIIGLVMIGALRVSAMQRNKAAAILDLRAAETDAGNDS